MRRNHFGSSTLLRALIVLTLAHAVLSQSALASKEPKTYPEVGKVTGVGQSKRSGGNGGTVFTRTYKVETDTKIYEVDCGQLPFFTRTGGECGGDKKLQIGDEIHFRTQKGWVYVPVTESGQALEQKLRILSEDLKPGAKPGDTK